MMVSARVAEDFPLLAGKKLSKMPAFYLCRDYTCLPPVFSVKELISLINKAPGCQLIFS